MNFTPIKSFLKIYIYFFLTHCEKEKQKRKDLYSVLNVKKKTIKIYNLFSVLTEKKTIKIYILCAHNEKEKI